MKFKSKEIEECEICGEKHSIGYREGVTEDIGIGSMHDSKEFCEKCFKENTYTNEFGFTFLKFNDRLFCYKPYHNKKRIRNAKPCYFRYTKIKRLNQCRRFYNEKIQV